ncbi:ribonuclease E [Buchnera aphidicola (Taiwanaphis decaspermi)]|uniref:ribonuclease E n=1 Tax=Buchnera aphidicola TaxID=9 RepID=UPI0031B7EF0E
MKRMLINATQKEELRIALVDGQKLYDLDIEIPGYEKKKSNIYKGKITRIEPSLEAAFVDYGSDKHGFLPLKEISREYFPSNYINYGRPNIKDIIKQEQEVIIQIDKEERGNKGASLTTFISLAGSYLVLMPNNPKVGGISRKIEGEDRNELKSILSSLPLPNDMGIIIRTAGLGKSIKDLKWDLSFRLKHWYTIKKISKTKKAPFLIYQESNAIVRAFRDYLKQDIGEILIDNPKILEYAKEHIISLGRPEFINKIKLYTGKNSLFSHYQIEKQINSAFQRRVRLPSGGSIILDTTEALTAIDINSSRFVKGIDIEETAFKTNLEAVDEISRQLRLRDLGGLIVIDFIDMNQHKNKKIVENKLYNIMRKDRARIQIGNISKFGLLEMSRQRLSSSLCESSYHVCPKCKGNGSIRDNESLSLSILRLIEEESLKDNTLEVHAIVPVEIACYLLNEKRNEVNEIEKRQCGGRTIIVPNNKMETPHYSVLRIKKGENYESISYHLPNLHKIKVSKSSKKIQNDIKKYNLSSNIMTNIFSCSNKKNNLIKVDDLFSKKEYIYKNVFFKFTDWLKKMFNINYIIDYKNKKILNKNFYKKEYEKVLHKLKIDLKKNNIHKFFDYNLKYKKKINDKKIKKSMSNNFKKNNTDLLKIKNRNFYTKYNYLLKNKLCKKKYNEEIKKNVNNNIMKNYDISINKDFYKKKRRVCKIEKFNNHKINNMLKNNNNIKKKFRYKIENNTKNIGTQKKFSNVNRGIKNNQKKNIKMKKTKKKYFVSSSLEICINKNWKINPVFSYNTKCKNKKKKHFSDLFVLSNNNKNYIKNTLISISIEDTKFLNENNKNNNCFLKLQIHKKKLKFNKDFKNDGFSNNNFLNKLHIKLKCKPKKYYSLLYTKNNKYLNKIELNRKQRFSSAPVTKIPSNIENKKYKKKIFVNINSFKSAGIHEATNKSSFPASKPLK